MSPVRPPNLPVSQLPNSSANPAEASAATAAHAATSAPENNHSAASSNNTVNTALALKDANLVQEVQARVLKKALNAQADTIATLMQSVAPTAIDSTLGSRINTHA